jgi:hypothetical protein
MGNPSVTKRQKERDRAERQREKEAKKRERKLTKDNGPSVPDGVDPDIAHIIPGPQPREDDEVA